MSGLAHSRALADPVGERQESFEGSHGDLVTVTDDPHQTGNGEIRIVTYRRDGARTVNMHVARDIAVHLRDALTSILGSS